MKLQVSGKIEHLIDHLKTAGEGYEIEEDANAENETYTILIKSTSALEIAHYTKMIDQISHCQLKGINIIQPNLEAIFLAATKRSWEEVRTKS